MNELPKGWEWKKLGDVCEIIMGQSPPGNSYNLESKGTPLLNGAADFSDKSIKAKQYTNKPTKLSKKGDILLCIRATIGNGCFSDREYCLGRGVCAVRPKNSNLDQNYLLYFLNREVIRLASMAEGSTIKGVRKNDMDKVDIIIPPYPIQKKIGQILQRSESLKQKREEANYDTNALIQSIFYELFGDVKNNSYNFPRVHIGQIARLQGGFAFKSSDYKKEGIKLVTISNVHYLRLIWGDDSYLPQEYLSKYSEFSLNEGDLVIAMTRPIIKSLDTVKLVEIQKSDLPALLNQRVGRFRLDSTKINKKYFEYFCYSNNFKNEIEKFSSVSLQPNVSSKQIESIEILMPPLSIQNLFAEIIKKIESLKLKQSESTSDINNLFDALMQQAFNGELVE